MSGAGTRPPGSVLAIGAVGIVLGVAAVALAVLGADGRAVTTVGALALGVIGAACIRWAHTVAPGEPDEEHRQVGGPHIGRRRLILQVGTGVAVVTGVALAVPAARRVERAERALRRTAWRDGVRLVDATGQLIRAEDIQVGDLVTVYPEGSVGDNAAQAMLIREPVERIESPPGRDTWHPEGNLVYSKLCTHMACPVSLYQSRRGVVLCPCHQATFDVLHGGAATSGPARRPLPQLPISIADDGTIVARGDFSDAVGTGFWGRP